MQGPGGAGPRRPGNADLQIGCSRQSERPGVPGCSIQRDFKYSSSFPLGGFPEAIQVDGGPVLHAGLEIEKAAGCLGWAESFWR